MESSDPMEGKKVKCELEYQDQPMDVYETLSDDFIEEGEIYSSDDEKSISEQLVANTSSIYKKNSLKNQKGVFFTSSNAFDVDEAQKRSARAKRFSFSIPTIDPIELNEEKLTKLYTDLGINQENERHYRFNALHMRGTENMSTGDVLQYFSDFSPSNVEWINDVSCNIKWEDNVSAAKALLKTSKKIKNLDKVHLNADPFEKDFKNDSKEELSDGDAVDAREISIAIPPGIWRIGKPCVSSSGLLLRYATRSDKKQRYAEKNSEYYKKYGNPNFGYIPGLISNSLRYEVKKSRFKSSYSYRSNNQGDKKNPWEELAFDWGKPEEEENREELFTENGVYKGGDISDLRISILNRKEQLKRQSDRLSVSDDETWTSKSKIPRMKMYADDEEERLGKNLKKKISVNKSESRPKKDLRSKINKNKVKTRFKFTSEKKAVSESSSSEDEYEDGDSGEWALEHYHDLRESLIQNKKQQFNAGNSESDSEGVDNIDDEFYKKDLNCRSPLQIEIENNEYYNKKV